MLTGNRFAHVCFQSGNFVVTGTLKPLRGGVALRAPASAQVALGGRTTGSSPARSGAPSGASTRKQKLRTYPRPVFVIAVDGGRILVDRDPAQLDVLSSARARSSATSSARTKAGRSCAADGSRRSRDGGSSLSDLHGRTLLTRTVAAGARLEDLDGGLARLQRRDAAAPVPLERQPRREAQRSRGQFGYAHARLSSGALFYALQPARRASSAMRATSTLRACARSSEAEWTPGSQARASS